MVMLSLGETRYWERGRRGRASGVRTRQPRPPVRVSGRPPHPVGRFLADPRELLMRPPVRRRPRRGQLLPVARCQSPIRGSRRERRSARANRHRECHERNQRDKPLDGSHGRHLPGSGDVALPPNRSVERQAPGAGPGVLLRRDQKITDRDAQRHETSMWHDDASHLALPSVEA